MRIGIIDADLIDRKKHRFPNLASMKISAYHKEHGDEVNLIDTYDGLDCGSYDHIYLSKVFTDTKIPEYLLWCDNVTVGGTGFYYDKAAPLAPEIEHHMPDYNLYNDWVNNKLQTGGGSAKRISVL